MAGLRHRRAGARPSGAAAAAARAGVVVVAPSAVDFRRALADARAPAARYARVTFDKRFAGLPADVGARVAFDPRVLLGQRSPQLAATPWGRSLRDGAAVLTTRGTELGAPFRITGDPDGLTPDDLPIATGAAAAERPRQRAGRPRSARPGAHARLRALRRPAVGARPARRAAGVPEARPERPRPERTVTSASSTSPA